MAEVVKGRHADRLPTGLYNKRSDARVLPAGQVVAPGRREGDGDGRAPIPGCELRVPVPGVDYLHVGFPRRPENHRFSLQSLYLFYTYGVSSLKKQNVTPVASPR